MVRGGFGYFTPLRQWVEAVMMHGCIPAVDNHQNKSKKGKEK
jgi:hypothetical protein